MNETHLQHVKAIFAEAIEKQGADREAFLAQACQGDPALRAEVESFLAAAEGAGEFLVSPTQAASSLATTGLSEGPGSQIGHYKLLEKIGEGGMGVVYMAEQLAPVRRKVAVKVIKPGYDTRQVIARFEAERQALAMMDHENIARVFDAGATDSGRPYFVMELVRGVPITDYCDHNMLPPRERLELFVTVCRAVQHAHTKGIIHRDLKPTNVLVTLHEGVAVPKVIDFGVAKATGQQLTEKTLFTNFAQMVGTPLYMSPEQAEMTIVDVDTRSDIYSLGVLLYELLTGTTPLDKERLKQSAFDEVRRIIREEEPPRPSTRLSTLGEQAKTISAQRKSDPAHLGRTIRGELDWIVMKALEKDRRRRYETANGLSRDIERYLHDEPVTACPPTASYRFRKFARRNKTALFLFTLVMASLLLLVTGLVISNRLIAAQRKEAEAQRARAEMNFLRARKPIQNILAKAAAGTDEWSQLQPSLRREFTESTVAFYESFLTDGNSDPELVYESAVAYRMLGELYDSQGTYNNAENSVRKAIPIQEKLSSDHPSNLQYRYQLAWSHYVLGQILKHSGQPAKAEAAYQKSISLFKQLINADATSGEYLAEWALAYEKLATVQNSLGEEQELKKTQDTLVAAYGAATRSNLDADAVKAFNCLSFALHEAGNHDDAVAASRRAVELQPTANHYNSLGVALNGKGDYQEALSAFHKSIELNPDYTVAYTNLTNRLTHEGDLEGAVATLHTLIQRQPANDAALDSIGSLLTRLGRTDEAIAEYSSVIARQPENTHALERRGTFYLATNQLSKAQQDFSAVIQLKPKDAGYEERDARVYLLHCSMWEGKYREIDALCSQILDIDENTWPERYRDVGIDMEAVANTVWYEQWLGVLDPDAFHRQEAASFRLLKLEQQKLSPDDPYLISVYLYAGFFEEVGGQLDKAAELIRHSLKLASNNSASSQQVMISTDCQMDVITNILGSLLEDENKLAESEKTLRQVMAMRRAKPIDSQNLSKTLTNLAHVLFLEGKNAEAEQLYQEALGMQRKLWVPPNLSLSVTMYDFAQLLLKERKFAEAESLFREALEIRTKLAPNTPATKATAQILVDLLEQTGRASEATTLCKQFALPDAASQPIHPK